MSRRSPASVGEALIYVVFFVVCIAIAIGINHHRTASCEAKGGHRAYAHAWYERAKNEQKVCLTNDGRIIR